MIITQTVSIFLLQIKHPTPIYSSLINGLNFETCMNLLDLSLQIYGNTFLCFFFDTLAHYLQ